MIHESQDGIEPPYFANNQESSNYSNFVIQVEAANLSLAAFADISIPEIHEMIEDQKKIPNLTKSRSNISAHTQDLAYSMETHHSFYEKIESLSEMIETNKNKFEGFLQLKQVWKVSESHNKFRQKFEATINFCLKILLVREGQIFALNQLFQNRHMKEEQFYKRYHFPLIDFMLRYPAMNEGVINLKMIFQIIKVEVPLLEKQKQIIDELEANIQKKIYEKKLISLITLQEKLKIVVKILTLQNSKLATIAQQFTSAGCLPFTDLISLNDDDSRHIFLNNFVERVSYGSRSEVRKSFEKIKANMNVINSIVGILDDPNSENKWLSTQILKCLLFKKSAYHETERMMAEPSVHVPKQIWDLSHEKKVKPLVKLASLPSITFHEKIYIPRTFKKVFDSKGQESIPEQFFISDIKEYLDKLKTEQQEKDAVLIRINSPFKLSTRSQNMIGMEECDKIILHFHGSGFVGFSTFVHQSYVRNWAKNLNIPILSVEYRKAPQNPYPCAIEDGFEAFLWAHYCFKQVYQINPKKIVLVGDSSGGNIAAVLANILIQWNLQKPTGLVMVYPPLNLNYQSFSPSLLYSLNDMILPHTFLKICLRCYLQDKDLKPESDHMISPLFADKSIFRQYPPCEIFIGDVDAFHDDALRFAEKINLLAPGRCRVTVFEEFPHGFIMFDMKMQGHKACGDATKKVEQALRRLINLQKNPNHYIYQDQDHRRRRNIMKIPCLSSNS